MWTTGWWWKSALLLLMGASVGLGDVFPSPLDAAPHDTHPDDVLEVPNDSDAANCNIVITSRQDYPRLMLNTGGPTATIRSLAFSPDSTRIYAAGFDKRVHVWGVRTASRGIRRVTVNTAVPVQNLHWEITRGLRGAIYDIAASPVNRELAIAGFSARDATGDIVVYDTAANTVVRALQGHLQAVAFLRYSPDGSRLASVTRDGEVRVWSQAADWQSVVLRESSGVSTQFQPLCFLNNDTLAVSVPRNEKGTSWQIALYDVANPQAPPRLLAQPHNQKITALAADARTGMWASADWGGSVYVWQNADAAEPKLLRKKGMALSLSFGTDQQLFVATALFLSETDGQKTSQSKLEMWNAATGELIDEVQTSQTEHNFVCNVSPDGNRVVTYAGDETELLVFLIKDRTGPIDKPLSKQPLKLRGAGDKRYMVAFEKDSYRLGFSSQPGKPIQHVFDPLDPKLVNVDPATLQWQTRDANANGWELRIVGGDRTKLRLYQSGQPKGAITVDPEAHGNVRTFCWLAADGETYGVALGTDVQNGVFVFAAAQEGECPLLRYFRDHNDFVTSLSCSSDGKYLASSSADQTIKIWSLEGIRAGADAFAKEPGWGARFRLVNDQVLLDRVLPAGTAARKGLRNGDLVVEATFGPKVARLLGMGDETLTTREPKVILDALQQCPLTENVLLTVDRRGSRLSQRVLLVPAWEPLLSLFVSRDGQWAAWTPQGYFDSSVDGDELFGWLVNKGVTKRAEFFRADQFRFELERPEAIRKLLTLGSVPAALRDSKHPIPEDPNRVVDQSARTKPIVSILNPVDGEELQNQVVRVRALVEFPTVDALERVKGNAFVNGVPGTVVDTQAAGLQRTYEWNISLTDVYNRLRVVAEDIAPDRMVNFSDVHFRLRPDLTPTGNPKLHIVTIAATDYQNVAKLELSISDANSVLHALRRRSGKLYEPGLTITMYNDQATRSRFYQTIQELVEKLGQTRPDDLLVVFLAGHGIAMDGEYYFVPVDGSRSNLKDVGIKWSDIRRLSLIPCRKLVLLDTCHSGSVLPLDQVGAANWKAAIRPLKLDEFLVVSATDVGQEALEFGEHGIFTQCILEALQGKATGGDIVYLSEVVQYVESEVPKRTAKLQLQTPRSSPQELFNLISVPLAASAE